MKALLYCTKAKPYLTKECDFVGYVDGHTGYVYYLNKIKPLTKVLNGTIVAQCEIEVEPIDNLGVCPSRYPEELLELSCLDEEELNEYLRDEGGYALHITELSEFDPPMTFERNYIYKTVHGMNLYKKAPQNMSYAYDRFGNKVALISIRPEWMQKILKGEKTIEIRRKVLKEMLKKEEQYNGDN